MFRYSLLVHDVWISRPLALMSVDWVSRHSRHLYLQLWPEGCICTTTRHRPDPEVTSGRFPSSLTTFLQCGITFRFITFSVPTIGRVIDSTPDSRPASTRSWMRWLSAPLRPV